MGFYPADQFSEFIEESKKKYRIRISYLEENNSFGTAGGLVSFKEELLRLIFSKRNYLLALIQKPYSL